VCTVLAGTCSDRRLLIFPALLYCTSTVVGSRASLAIELALIVSIFRSGTSWPKIYSHFTLNECEIKIVSPRLCLLDFENKFNAFKNSCYEGTHNLKRSLQINYSTMINTEARQRRIGLFVFVCSLIGCSFSLDICTCQPSRYRLTFNFSQSCNDSSVKPGGVGIDDVACTVQSLQGNATPVGITSVEISELDQNLVVVSSEIFNNKTFVDGDSIRYSSIIATARTELVANTTARPRGLQVVMTGVDKTSTQVVNKWVIIFNNACDEAPVLKIGQSIGWISLVS
jgi:hypothetical protein